MANDCNRPLGRVTDKTRRCLLSNSLACWLGMAATFLDDLNADDGSGKRIHQPASAGIGITHADIGAFEAFGLW